ALSAKPLYCTLQPATLRTSTSWPSPIGPIMRGVAAGVSAQRSGAANGGGGRQPPDPCEARQALMIAWPWPSMLRQARPLLSGLAAALRLQGGGRLRAIPGRRG